MGISYGNYEPTERKKREVVDNATFVACIQFYRSKEQVDGKYGNKDLSYKGEFGFDKFDPRVCAEGLIAEYESLTTVMPKAALFGNIQKYFCPYLSIWPPNVEGNLENSKSKVTLYVKAEEANVKLAESAIIEFVSSDPNIIIVGLSNINLKINDGIKPLVIECKGEFEKDVTIEAKVKGETKILGKLIIKANAVRYKTLIQPVELIFGTVENFGLPEVSHTSFIQNLVKDFNIKSFNQAYIYGELAPNTKKIALNKSEFVTSGLFSTKEDGLLYLKKDTEDDPSTVEYNTKVEERYAASLIKGGLEKKRAEERLAAAAKQVLMQFARECSFEKAPNSNQAKRHHENKKATKAWNKPNVVNAYEAYKVAKLNYETLGGDSIGLDKTGKIHFFYTNDIHGARNPESKVLAYSAPPKGVAHIFESAIKSIDANSVILHELGHGLGLHHTFDSKKLGDYTIKESGKRYKDEIDKEIEFLDGDGKDNIGEIRTLEKQKRDIERLEKTGANQNEIVCVRQLQALYMTIQICIDKKESISLQHTENSFIKYFEKDNNLKILELEANPLDFDYNKTSLSAAEIDISLNKSKAKLQELQLERRNAVEAPTYSKAKAHSKTNENYMDYYQDSNSNTNTDFERKSYYQWQWNEVRKAGIENHYFIEI